MKPLSPRAQELVSRLERDTSLSEKLLGRTTEDEGLLSDLAACAQPALAPHLLRFVFGDNRSVARAAANTLDRVIAATVPADLAQVEEACRRTCSPYLPSLSGWTNLRPVEVSRFSGFGETEASVIGVASFHASGYVREAAVTRLDALAGGCELPFLLRRLNDWVMPVAERARIAVERRLSSAYADAFLDNLPILLALIASKRREHTGLLERVYRLLRSPDHASVLLRGRNSPDRSVRRISFRLARETEGADIAALLQHALRDADTVIRLEAVADATRCLTSVDAAPTLAIILADPYPPVRREGLAVAVALLGEGAHAWLLAAAMDRNRVVREVARFFLMGRRMVSDFSAYYRERLHVAWMPRELATALAGLGETGARSDAPAVAPFLTHDRPSVRRASARAIATLDIDAHLPRIVAMLRDPTPVVADTARRLLRPHAKAVGLEALRSILHVALYAHSRFAAASLGTSLEKWESLTILLEAAADDDTQIRTMASRALGNWVIKQNRSFTRPTSEQLVELRAALDAYQPAADASIAAELRSILRYWTA